jgi:hypothetical protein
MTVNTQKRQRWHLLWHLDESSSVWCVILVLAIHILNGCGKNLGDCGASPRLIPCTQKTPEDIARQAMADHDYDLAVETLEPRVETLKADSSLSDQEKFRLHPLLAAAFAGRAGFSVFSALQSQPSSGGSQGNGGIIGQMSSFVPSPTGLSEATYRSMIADMGSATVLLKEIPENLLADTQGESFGKSAVLQLTLYLSAHSVMIMNQFILSPATGAFDASRLASMSDADAEAILNSLTSASQVPGAENPEVKNKVEDALSAIDASPGESRREKLQDYLAKNGGGTSA